MTLDLRDVVPGGILRSDVCHVEHGDGSCSRCRQPVPEGEVPLILWGQGGRLMWVYCERCCASEAPRLPEPPRRYGWYGPRGLTFPPPILAATVLHIGWQSSRSRRGRLRLVEGFRAAAELPGAGWVSVEKVRAAGAVEAGRVTVH